MPEVERTGWIVGFLRRIVQVRESIGTKTMTCALSLLIVLLKPTRS